MGKRRIMLIGPSECGKTTLANAINGVEGPVRKTQDLIFGKHTMDVPGSYIETPWMYRHLISAAQNHAAHILMLVDQGRCREIGAPGFAKVFNCPVTGVVTKTDLNPENEGRCLAHLKRLGAAQPYYKVSGRSGDGMAELTTYLEEQGLMQ
ncbi:MAG: ethanolamine utilization protein EutP [Desulfobacter sp.]|nr:MAG: ethanolamine utilization protein EutP [Desulfobacter sp.]